MAKSVIQGKHYRITVLTNQLVRMEYSQTGVFENRLTQTVINRTFEAVDVSVSETETQVQIHTPTIDLFYEKEKEFNEYTVSVDVRFETGYTHHWRYGDTEWNLKGTTRTLDGANGEIPLEDGIMSRNGITIMDDSTTFAINDENQPVPRLGSETDCYLFAYGHNYVQALKDFYQLTGQTPLLPRYALGNWWSRYWKYSEDSYLTLIEKFNKEKVPLSVSVIDMDWHLTEVPERFGNGWTGYTWDKKLFPNPNRFMKSLHDRGLAITLNVHPADGIRAFEEAYPRVAKRLNLNQEAEEPARFDLSDDTFRMSYFEDVHHPMEEDGVDFWWIDWQQGTKSEVAGLDPLWQLNHYHFLDQKNRKHDPLILSRYAGPGSHRYPIGFSGDTIISWESLDFQPYMTATASNIGYTWWSHDIGGHMSGYKDEELSLRWLQFGVFSPINRLHSSSSAFTSKEPWEYEPTIAGIMKDYLRFRHALLPYLYTANVNTHEQGEPLMQPMYYRYPELDASYQTRNQYFFGSELLVAPITQPMDRQTELGKVQVFLPQGDWFDLFRNCRYEGDTTITMYRSLKDIPVLAKAGAIIPLDAHPEQTKASELPTTIRWEIFPGSSNQYELIEDNGTQRCITRIQLDNEMQKLTIDTQGDVTMLPSERQHEFHLRVTDEVLIGGDAIFTKYDKQRKEQIILINQPEGEQIVTLTGFAYSKTQTSEQAVFDLLKRANIENELKDHFWDQYQNEKSKTKRFNLLSQLSSRELSQALFECEYTDQRTDY
ncbi:glycoside hydrolase family 31 protein [Enterococcus italicus]|uniref:glycoside hydrolase family 31 protein n=1 Tax=Enterococcus italicus TaxID=246144 RepID=UPI0028A97EDA|nr:TIM-barrel domain-containing protein [Enterococcus italicus]